MKRNIGEVWNYVETLDQRVEQLGAKLDQRKDRLGTELENRFAHIDTELHLFHGVKAELAEKVAQIQYIVDSVPAIARAVADGARVAERLEQRIAQLEGLELRLPQL